jgi:hypothetical protein
MSKKNPPPIDPIPTDPSKKPLERRRPTRPGTPVDDVAIEDLYQHGKRPRPANKPKP